MRNLLLILAVLGCGGAPRTSPAPEPAPAQVDAAPEGGGLVTRADVVAAWKSELTDFESIQLEDDGSFTSHLHDRPFSDGTWTVEGDLLLLRSPAYGDTSITLKRRDGEHLLISVDDETGTWIRIP